MTQQLLPPSDDVLTYAVYATYVLVLDQHSTPGPHQRPYLIQPLHVQHGPWRPYDQSHHKVINVLFYLLLRDGHPRPLSNMNR
jgi:hypothetical protein